VTRDLFIAGALIVTIVALLFQLGLVAPRRAADAHGRQWRELLEKLELQRVTDDRHRGAWRDDWFVLQRVAEGVAVRVAVDEGPLAGLTLMPRARAVGEAPANVTAPARARARALWAWFDSAPDRWIEDGQLSATVKWADASPAAIHRLVEEMAQTRRAIAEG
jgi:hypothetical protein